MMNPEKSSRLLSAMAKTDCIFLLLNHDAFNILLKSELKRDSEILTYFLLDHLPKLKELFSF